MAGRAAVGLDIGTSGVRAAEVSLGRSPHRLERFGQVGLPAGAVRGGEVVDVDAVAAAIRQLWQQVRFSTKKVVVGVSNQKVVVRQVDLPWLPAEELKRSLPFQVQDFVPMPVDQAILDYHPLSEYIGEDGGRMARLLLVAADREMVQATVSAVTKAGLEPRMVDLTSFAVLRSLAAGDGLDLDGGEAEAVIDVGASVTNIVIHEAGVPRFVRILLMGGQDVTDALADRMGIPVEQAETVKQAHTAATPVGPVAHNVMESSGASFVDEIRSSLDYYLAQPASARIRRVTLSGGGALLGGLAERMSSATRLPVQLSSPLQGMEIGRTGLTDEQLAHSAPLASVPVGLAMGMAS